MRACFGMAISQLPISARPDRRAGHRRDLDQPDDFRFLRIIERADPRGPVDRHRRRALKQVRGHFIGVESRVTRRRVFAKLKHEFQRGYRLPRYRPWLATCIEHLSAESPEDRHEIRDHGIALRGPHHVPVNAAPARRACSLSLIDQACRSQNIFPGRGRFQAVFVEKVFAVKEQLRVADVGQSVSAPDS